MEASIEVSHEGSKEHSIGLIAMFVPSDEG